MAKAGFKSFLPSFITIAFELMQHWKRDYAHNNNIKKLDKTTEKLGTIENMLLRLEKKIQANRNLINRLQQILFVSLGANLILLLIILIKLLGLL